MMGQGFSFKFDEMKDGDPSKKETEKAAGNPYAEAGHVRNICFVWPDGRMKFLNYAYLVSGSYLPDENKIILAFTSETVLLKGSRLDILFMQLIGHLPKFVVCVDPRYNVLEEDGKFQVNEIEVSDTR